MNYTLVKGKDKGMLVYIHGNSSSSEVFNEIMNSKIITHSMLAIDLPGHGKSTYGYANMDDFSMASYCKKIETLLNKIDDDILIVGNSLGGYIAIEISEKIERLKGLVIFGTAPLKKPLNIEEAFLPVPELQTFLKENPSDADIECAANIAVYDKNLVKSIIRVFKETNPKVRNAFATDLTGNFLQDEFEIFTELKISKFIIAGTHDPSINLDYLKFVTESCHGNCELITFTDCGHYPSLEKPEAFIETMHHVSNKLFKKDHP